VTADVSGEVRANARLLAGAEDHYVPLTDQITTLTAARSATARVFTGDEHAQNHVQAGNIALPVQVMLGLAGQHGQTRQPAWPNVIDIADRDIEDALARSFLADLPPELTGWSVGEREAGDGVDGVFGDVSHDGDADTAGGIDPDQVEEADAAA